MLSVYEYGERTQAESCTGQEARWPEALVHWATRNIAGGNELETSLRQTLTLIRERRKKGANTFVDGGKIGGVLALWYYYYYYFSDVESYLVKCQGRRQEKACGER